MGQVSLDIDFIDILILNKFYFAIFRIVMIISKKIKCEVAKLNFSGKRDNKPISSHLTSNHATNQPSFYKQTRNQSAAILQANTKPISSHLTSKHATNQQSSYKQTRNQSAVVLQANTQPISSRSTSKHATNQQSSYKRARVVSVFSYRQLTA